MLYHKPALPISLFSNIKQMNVVWMVIDSFFKSGTPVPPPMEGRKIPIPRNFKVMISRYEWFLTYFCQQAKKVEQVIFCPMNVPQHPFLSRSFKPVMYRSSKTGHKQVIFSFGSVGKASGRWQISYCVTGTDIYTLNMNLWLLEFTGSWSISFQSG